MTSVSNFFHWSELHEDSQDSARGADDTLDTNSDSSISHKMSNSKDRGVSRNLANKAVGLASIDPIDTGRHKGGSAVPGSATTSLKAAASASLTGSSLQKAMTDTLVEKIVKMTLPPSSQLALPTIANRMAAAKDRPGLSVQVMSRNFIQMNSRLSIPFAIIDEIIKVLNWEQSAYSVCCILVVSIAIMKPWPILTSFPIFFVLFGIMVPQYLYIHKPEDNDLLDQNRAPAQGPPLRKVVLPKPVPEFSQEFVLNLTDLQNHMLIYVRTYDVINSCISSFAFFQNEQISCLAFVILLIVALFNLLFMEYIVSILPVKFITLVLFWCFIAAFHPHNRDKFLSKVYSEDTRISLQSTYNKYHGLISEHLRYVEAREQRLVTIFEIQYYKEKYKEWKPLGYSSDDYTLFSDMRINQLSIRDHSVPTLEDVLPPDEWEWTKGSRWVLDLDPKVWVEEGLIQYVTIDQETKWVYDLDLNGNRGKYRRRMWTNTCGRKVDMSMSTADDLSVMEEVVNPMREEKYAHGVHGVSKGSMAGASRPIEDGNGTIYEPRSSAPTEDNMNEMASLKKLIDEDQNKLDSSSCSLEPNESLADVLNHTF